MAVVPPAATLPAFFRRMEFGRLTRDAEEAVQRSQSLDLFPDDPAPAAPRAAEPRAKSTAAGVWLEEPPPTDATYRTATDAADLDALVAELRTATAGIAVDTETTGIDPMRADLVGLSFSTAPGTGWYVPVAHVAGPNADRSEVTRRLGPILADPALPKVGQNIKYDLVILDRHGLPVDGVAFDTMVASYLLDSERSHKLDNLAHDELGYRMVPIVDVIGRGAKQRSFADVPVALATRYAAEDADITLRLRDRFAPRLGAQDLDGLFRDVEMPLLGVLKEMEETGVAVDTGFLGAMSERLGAEMTRLETEARRAAGEPFNLNSPAQLGKLLFEKFQLPAGKKTKTGWSTDSETL
jgi:DNA polymerase-1